ncbi:MAG TPA: bifunctional phosphoribosylaminoimidazolecarboxamide formyltransferase/IMP cyclohydrolase [Acidobacteriaceae bacterium]
MADRKQIRRALLSVTNKSGLTDLAHALARHGVELISTGGTARALREAGFAVRDVAELTGFPEMLDGRVKTLHPRVHGGILHIRGNPAHQAAIGEHSIEPIDMVVVNLYAFEQTAGRADTSFAELIENIDIGGPSMVRSAAKNFEDVAVVTDPADYPRLIEELNQAPVAPAYAEAGASLSRQTRWYLARKAFALTAAYDMAIASTLEAVELPAAAQASEAVRLAAGELPSSVRLNYPRSATLRYGENPHQHAALYADRSGLGIAGARQMQGKELSYNNLVDLDACWELTREFPAEEAAMVAIIKHTNPCGAATGETLLDAYTKALASDPISAFGGVIGVNRVLDEPAAEEMARLFVEAIAAPGFTPGALARLSAKKNLRVVEVKPAHQPFVFKQVSGGLLLQEADHAAVDTSTLRTVTRRAPTEEELRALLFAWRVTKHVKSNAIVYARDGQTLGVGAGQMSRVDAARFGAMKAVLPLAGCVAASDAFFPFADGVEVVAGAGATAVIQPGGSLRDEEVIAAADRLGLAMVLTAVRHFRH